MRKDPNMKPESSRHEAVSMKANWGNKRKGILRSEVKIKQHCRNRGLLGFFWIRCRSIELSCLQATNCRDIALEKVRAGIKLAAARHRGKGWVGEQGKHVSLWEREKKKFMQPLKQQFHVCVRCTEDKEKCPHNNVGRARSINNALRIVSKRYLLQFKLPTRNNLI